METPENPLPAPVTQPDLGELQGQVQSLRQLVNTLLVLLLVVSGTFTIYMVRVWKFAKNDTVAIRQQATPVIEEYNKVSRPAMIEFVRKLAEYSQKHPDFAPIAAKYKLDQVLAKPATTLGTGAPPAAVPAKK